MDSPDPVRRVTPPSTTIANTMAQQISNHNAMARCAAVGSAEVLTKVSLIGRQY
jgi:hypothetical protein